MRGAEAPAYRDLGPLLLYLPPAFVGIRSLVLCFPQSCTLTPAGPASSPGAARALCSLDPPAPSPFLDYFPPPTQAGSPAGRCPRPHPPARGPGVSGRPTPQYTGPTCNLGVSCFVPGIGPVSSVSLGNTPSLGSPTLFLPSGWSVLPGSLFYTGIPLGP